MIQIEPYGPVMGDETSLYHVHISRPMTVKEFVQGWLSVNRKEWGKFEIRREDENIKKERNFWYQHENLNDEIPSEILERKIVKVSGSGGWGRSDFYITTE